MREISAGRDVSVQVFQGSPESFVRAQLERSLPTMIDLFEIICDPDEVPSSIFRTSPTGWIAPYEVPYVKSRMETENVQESIYGALLDAGGVLLVRSRSGLGKTREVAELSTLLCSQGWTVCVAMGGEADTSLNRLKSFPDELRGERLLLIFDDLHRRVGSSVGDQVPYSERLEALLSYLMGEINPSDLRVLVTARDEPYHKQQLDFDPTQPPWFRFGQYELPEFTQDGLEAMLFELAELAQVDVDKQTVGLMIANCDRTLRTLYENINRARVSDQTLTLESWLPSRGESWEIRYRDARGRYKCAEEVYLALHLIRDAGLPTRHNYVTQLSSKLAQDNTQTTIDGLIDMGLLGSRRGVLDPFSDEQLSDSLRNTGRSLPVITDYWISLIEAVTEVTEKTADWLEDLNKLSMRLTVTNNYETAIAITDIIIEQKPEDATAYFIRGNARIFLDDNEKAEEDYSAAIERGRHDADVYCLRATIRLNRNDFSGAEADFTSAIQYIQDDPEDDMLLGIVSGMRSRARGNQLYKLGDFTGAIADYTSAIEHDPDDASAYYNRALARTHDDLEGAEVDFSNAIEYGMDNADVYNHRGLSRTILGNYTGAEEDYNAAIERGKDDADVYSNRGIVRRVSGNYVDAEKDYNAAIERGKDDADVYFERGSTRLGLDNYVDAEKDYNAAIERGKDDAKVYHNRGLARIGLDNYVDAEKDYNAAIERGKDDADVYYFRGRIRQELGNLVGAEADFTSVIDRKPDHQDAINNLGVILRSSRRWQEAIHIYRRAVAIDNSRYDYWVGLADCARKVKDEETWREAIEQAKPLLDTENYYNAACLASVAGEENQAIELLERALKERPELVDWAKEDPELNWIRNDPRFWQIIGSVKGQ